MAKERYTNAQIDRTRRNLGEMSDEEAASMVKVLGGEVGNIVDDTESPTRKSTKSASQHILRKSTPPKERKAQSGGKFTQGSSSKPAYLGGLPSIGRQTMRMFFKLYYGERHKIVGFSTYFFGIVTGAGVEKLASGFLTRTLDDDLRLCIRFASDAQNLLSMIPSESTELLKKNGVLSYRFLSAAYSWNFSEANASLVALQRNGEGATVQQAVPFVKEIFRNLISVVFVNDSLFMEICAQLESEIGKNSKVPQGVAKKAMNDLRNRWARLQKNVICGLYPILMRALIKDCLPINDFFALNIAKILEFLGVPRYALVLATEHGGAHSAAKFAAKATDFPVNEGGSASGATSEEGFDEEFQSKNKDLAQRIEARKMERDEFLQRQLEFADMMFPSAGWFELEKSPDFFAYFQPLFDFPDGFNEIAPDNPMQFVAILLRIIDDLTAAANHIKFRGDDLRARGDVNLDNALQNGYLYMNDNFQRDFIPMLSDYVNNLYSSPSFANSPNAQKALAKIYWYQKVWFLPYYKFELSYMENEVSSKKRNPLYREVASMSQIMAEISSNIDAALKNSGGRCEGDVAGIANPWTPYEFALPNPCSRRLNAVLGGRNSTRKNNANLVKAISAFFYILDWFLNDVDSPAYLRKGVFPFRRDFANAPDFSVNLRGDVNEIFVSNLKKKMALAKGEKNEQG